MSPSKTSRRVLVVEWAPDPASDEQQSVDRKKSKKKSRHSPELAPLHLGEAIGVRSAERASRALQKGVAAYRRQRRKATRRGRDGALVEMPLSFARAGAAMAEEMARAPADVVRTIDRRQARRASEQAVRAVRRALRR